MLKTFLLLFLLTFCVGKSFAQDPQFSQFYASPLYLNPAFAGASQSSRAIFNYRNQWPSIDANFVTYAASFDHFVRKYNSGVGVLAYQDIEGPGLTSTNFSVQYAYQLSISKKYTFRPGFQVSYISRSLDFNNLKFGNQFNPDGTSNGGVSGEPIGASRVNFLDYSVGGVFYSQNSWVGVGVHHLTQPSQSFYGQPSSELPMKISAHAGYRIILPITEFPYKVRSGQRNPRATGEDPVQASFSPVINYKRQGVYNQLDAGFYFNYNPIVLGMWYRGLPINPTSKKLFTNDALIFLIGLKIVDFRVGYSYDVTISKLGTATGGAHELSLIYDFYLGYRNQKKRKPAKNIRVIPCPKF